MKRGDVVLAAAPGDYGKPRPSVVVQSDLLNPTHPSIVICPLTSSLVDAPDLRITVDPTPGTGLRLQSQIMVDKVQAIRRDRIRDQIGALDERLMARVGRSLALVLGLA